MQVSAVGLFFLLYLSNKLNIGNRKTKQLYTMNIDANPVHILYDNNKLRDVIMMVMEGRENTLGITFVNLCYQILQLAEQEKMVQDSGVVIHTSNEIAPEDQVRVSRVLWELIWDHKVFLLFGRSPLLGLSNGEDRFVKY